MSYGQPNGEITRKEYSPGDERALREVDVKSASMQSAKGANQSEDREGTSDALGRTT